MKNYLIVGGVAVMSLLLSCQKGPLILADQGQSEYVIVVSPKATESEQHAAHELCRMVGVTRLSEWHTTPDEYDVQMHEFFQTIH